MDCSRATNILTGGEEADLSDAEARALSAHLVACLSCRDALGQAEAELRPLAEGYRPPEPTPEQWERVRVGVMAAAQAAPVIQLHQRRASPWPLAWAAAAALLFGLGIALLRQDPRAPGGLPAPTVSTVLLARDLSTCDGVEPQRVEAGADYWAGSFATDELVCIWVRPR